MRRIIYLGGLGHGDHLSRHLASRQEVGDVLRASGVEVVELRASVIVGAGSTSFELARALVEKLPVMIAPRWVRTKSQPIAVEDVLDYLEAALDVDPPGAYEIGGGDVVSYGDVMAVYARLRGLRRLIIPVPVLSPRLSALWLGLVSPRHSRVGRHLIEGVRNASVVRDHAAERAFPKIRPRGITAAVREAVAGAGVESPALSGKRSTAVLALCVAACLGVGAVGGLVTSSAVTSWYPGLAKPPWTPPSWVFAPVWTMLYLMMGVAAWLVWRRDGLREARLALGVFAVGLVLNAAWSILFFGLRSPGAALADIVVLDLAIAVTLALFAARSRMGSLLLVPYLAWSLFATALNLAIWRMNGP